MRTVVFYDNLCGVCNYWVNWILANDSKDAFYFAALESEFTNQFSHHFNYVFPPETIVIWNDDAGFLKKSDAVIFIFQSINRSSIQVKILRLFPKFIRDWGYSIFAYFRRYVPMKQCKLPSSAERKLFMTDKSFQFFLNKYKD